MNSILTNTKLTCLIASISIVFCLPAIAISSADSAYVDNLLKSFNSIKIDDQMLDKVTGILESDPKASKARFLLGLMLEKRGFENLAMDQYKQCVKEDPKNYHYHFQLMLIALKAKENKLAIDEMFTCQKLANGNGLLLLKLGLTMENVGFSMLAQQVFEQAAAAKEKAYGVGYSLAKLRVSQGRLDEALKCLNWDLIKNPNSAKANILKGQILLRMNMPTDAAKYYMRAFKSNPCDSNAANLVTKEFIKQGMVKDALGPALTDILCNCSNKDKLLLVKKTAAKILKTVPIEFSKQTIVKVAATAPSARHRQFYYLALGDVFDSINKPDLAMQTYQAGLNVKTNPRNDLAVARGYYRLGVDLEMWKREPENALKMYESSIEINPQDAEVRHAYNRLKLRMKNRHKDTAGRIKDSLLKQMRSQ